MVFDIKHSGFGKGRTVRPGDGGGGLLGARSAPLQQTWYLAGTYTIPFDAVGHLLRAANRRGIQSDSEICIDEIVGRTGILACQTEMSALPRLVRCSTTLRWVERQRLRGTSFCRSS